MKLPQRVTLALLFSWCLPRQTLPLPALTASLVASLGPPVVPALHATCPDIEEFPGEGASRAASLVRALLEPLLKGGPHAPCAEQRAWC